MNGNVLILWRQEKLSIHHDYSKNLFLFGFSWELLFSIVKMRIVLILSEERLITWQISFKSFNLFTIISFGLLFLAQSMTHFTERSVLTNNLPENKRKKCRLVVSTQFQFLHK